MKKGASLIKGKRVWPVCPHSDLRTWRRAVHCYIQNVFVNWGDSFFGYPQPDWGDQQQLQILQELSKGGTHLTTGVLLWSLGYLFSANCLHLPSLHGHRKLAKGGNIVPKQSQGPPCPLSLYVLLDGLKPSSCLGFVLTFFFCNAIPQTQKSEGICTRHKMLPPAATHCLLRALPSSRFLG